MARGFRDTDDFALVIGWELDQVTFDKYHVMFHFSPRCLLNVAHSFTVRSPAGGVDLTYKIYGDRKTIVIDPLLRQSIAEARVVSVNQLDLVFGNEYVLSVFDDPDLRSWWFLSYLDEDAAVRLPGDCELEDLREWEYRGTGLKDRSAGAPLREGHPGRRYVIRSVGDDENDETP